jgi:signal transduction histidine kinase
MKVELCKPCRRPRREEVATRRAFSSIRRNGASSARASASSHVSHRTPEDSGRVMRAGVAHEVRNPLGGIALFSGLLQEDLQAGAHPGAGAHVSRIQREVACLQRIVEDFLAFAREQPLSRAPVEAPSLLSGACELLAAEAAARGVAVDVEAATPSRSATPGAGVSPPR